MRIFTPLCFHLCWMLTLDLMPITCSTIQLGMVEESVDDMYDGCSDKMKNVLDQNFSKERKHVGWTTSNRCAEDKLKERSPEDMALTKDHLQAICMYTGYVGYNEINKAIREQKNTYGTSFQFHIFHFFLTTAIQILKLNQNCHTTYRRTPDKYEGQVGQTIRFGYFASSSIDSDLTQFGKETCFKITTCLGANLKHYPTREEAESEILIPPYETFTIKEKLSKKEAPAGLTDCERVYVLENKGYQSNLNCKLVGKLCLH
ncbi:T-cell ecto-ADP-ribosyltransferase 1 [Nematolebias whitei]|uniref:T-cell ecto-ADP-ribosyltransferase 1 n=1 Tax=Nematolebias whitei TaxID=451745 RepID=UPI001896DD2F|nr:T-cell ecto-ADP-ribosyltransferase 1 [Nematolebias whitei]